jgi:hypothetical protein
MKLKNILILACLLTVSNVNAQTDFKIGYIVKENGDTILGEIDSRGDKFMSKNCRFIPIHSDSIISYSPNDIKEFRFKNSKCYVSRTLESGESLFLEYLIKGKLNVYYYRDEANEDHYLIDKEGFPLKVLPYKEGIEYNENGTRVFFQTKSHIGLLNLYTQDAPELQAQTNRLLSPGHGNLIKLAENYNNIVCKNEECIIYEKEVPFIKASIEFIYGMSIIRKRIVANDKTNDFGMNVYLWMPRISEKLYFKTGIAYEHINLEGTHHFLKMPIQLYYQYSHYKLRPFIFVGENIYYIKFPYYESSWVFSTGGGLNYKISNNISISGNINADFTPILPSVSNHTSIGWAAFSADFGIRIEL